MFNYVVDPEANAVDLTEETVTLTRLNGDQTITVPDDSIKPNHSFAHASSTNILEEPLVPV